MKKALHKTRFHLFIAGISSLAFAVITLAFPALSLLSLVGFLGAYMIIKGITIIIGAWQTRQEERHWLFLLYYGLFNVLTGIVALLYPQPTLFILGFIVSFNLLVCGILQIIIAYHLRKEVDGIGWLVFSGIVATTAGAYIYLIPRVSASVILTLIAVAGLLLGTFLITLSLSAFNWHGRMKKSRIEIQ